MQWLKKWRDRKFLFALVLGAATPLAFAPFDLKFLAPLSLALLIGLAASGSARRAFALGWCWGLGFFSAGIHWIFISTHIYGGAPWWLGLLLCTVLFSYMALYPALVMGIAARFNLFQRAIGLLALPLLWVLSELLRDWVFTGFPWLSLGYLATDTVAARLAPITGVYGISAMVVLAALLLYWLAAHAWVTLRFIALILLPLLWGVLQGLPAPAVWTQAVREPVSTAIVQGNIAQDQKWLSEMQLPTLLRYRDLSLEAMDARLVVWPEVALTQRYDQVRDNLLAQLDASARLRGSTLLAGLIIRDDEKNGVYNSIITLGTDQGRYDKHHLVPFGEFFPIPGWLRPMMDVLGTPYSDFLFGSKTQPPQKLGAETIGLSICFEDVFGNEFRQLAKTSSLLMNATNDAWFGHSPAAEQHLQIARLRALETGREILRASNTGRSAIISAEGEINASAGFYTTELLRGSAQPRSGLTPYVRWGDAPLWGLSLMLLLFLTWEHRRRA